MKPQGMSVEHADSGLRLVHVGPSLMLEDVRQPRRGRLALWLEEVERLLDPSLGAPGFDPHDEFLVLYRHGSLMVERVAEEGGPGIRLSYGSEQAFLLTTSEWNALIGASVRVLRALRAREGVSWQQFVPCRERSAA